MPEPVSNEPRPGNFELQQQFLEKIQEEISAELFEKGVVSRIVSQESAPRGVTVDLDGVNQWDAVYFPVLQKTKTTDGKEEERLSLVAKTQDESNGYGYTYYGIGMIDDTGTLFPSPEINGEDAEEVQRAAQHLQALKEDGTLPNLTYTLQFVNNPNTSIRSQPKAS